MDNFRWKKITAEKFYGFTQRHEARSRRDSFPSVTKTWKNTKMEIVNDLTNNSKKKLVINSTDYNVELSYLGFKFGFDIQKQYWKK